MQLWNWDFTSSHEVLFTIWMCVRDVCMYFDKEKTEERSEKKRSDDSNRWRKIRRILPSLLSKPHTFTLNWIYVVVDVVVASNTFTSEKIQANCGRRNVFSQKNQHLNEIFFNKIESFPSLISWWRIFLFYLCNNTFFPFFFFFVFFCGLNQVYV